MSKGGLITDNILSLLYYKLNHNVSLQGNGFIYLFQSIEQMFHSCFSCFFLFFW